MRQTLALIGGLQCLENQDYPNLIAVLRQLGRMTDDQLAHEFECRQAERAALRLA